MNRIQRTALTVAAALLMGAASCDVPAIVLTGPWSPPHIVAAAEALAGLLPAAQRATDGDLVAAARSLL